MAAAGHGQAGAAGAAPRVPAVLAAAAGGERSWFGLNVGSVQVVTLGSECSASVSLNASVQRCSGAATPWVGSARPARAECAGEKAVPPTWGYYLLPATSLRACGVDFHLCGIPTQAGVGP